MDDKQLLQAMQSMIQDNNKALGQMMDDKIGTLREELIEKIDAVKEDTTEIRSATNSLIAWADEVAVITQVKFPVKKAK